MVFIVAKELMNIWCVMLNIWKLWKLFSSVMCDDKPRHSVKKSLYQCLRNLLLLLIGSYVHLDLQIRFVQDDLDDREMQKMEEAREAYIAAVASAKEKQDEKSIAAAASARLHLQSFVFRSNNMKDGKVSPRQIH